MARASKAKQNKALERRLWEVAHEHRGVQEPFGNVGCR